MKPRGWAARLAVGVIHLYRRFISPLLPNACRFTPSCSVYSQMAYAKYGFWRGSLKTAGRLLRCNPFHPGGEDLP